MRFSPAACPPVLSCAAARQFETSLFGGVEETEWRAMQCAGKAIAEAVLQDAREIGGFGVPARLLVLVGKGHNGGDALIAATELLRRLPSFSADVLFAFGERSLRPLAERAWREFSGSAADRLVQLRQESVGEAGAGGTLAARRVYDLCLDGVFGFQFRPPVTDAVASLLGRVNDLPIRLRAAVDLPSAGLFRADFTYATGSVKRPVLEGTAAGRIRYLDLGFFTTGDETRSPSAPIDGAPAEYVLTPSILDGIAGFRSPHSDKRHYGHVMLLGGSRSYPGAILMAVTAAVRSGAGLVTAFVPESLAAAFAAQVPEAMWVAWPETPGGNLALEGEHLLHERAVRAQALVIGPGLGREPETLALVESVARRGNLPLVLDADALQPQVVTAGSASRIVTPHAGELARIAPELSPIDLARSHEAMTVVAKGPVTRICSRTEVMHSTFGGPVLARGGSGDMLAGMIGTQLAQTPDDPMGAAARAVVWHGLAAEQLARTRGQVAVRATELLDYLAEALRGR